MATAPCVRAERLVSRPIISRQMAGAGPELITFLDLIELFFVAMFYDKGVSLTYIRKAAETAQREFDTDHPFAVQQFETDGSRIFVMLQAEPDSGSHTQELIDAQYVFDDQVRPFFKTKLDCDLEGVTRFWPLGKGRCVVLDPHRSFGKPLDVASGVPTRPLYQAHLAGETIGTIARWYEIPPETVECAVEYEQSLLA